MRVASTILLGCLLLGLLGLLGCQRGKEQAVVIDPNAMQTRATSMPGDPFGSASPAYAKLVEVTDAALAAKWSGTLEEFAPWLEEETVAVERALALLKAIRVGPRDVYAVANGRIAMVYDEIAVALTEASRLAEADGFDADWKGQEGRLWEQSNAFWERCARGCSLGGTHLDAWDLRCQSGLANSLAKLGL
jgi:hypothetical protein